MMILILILLSLDFVLPEGNVLQPRESEVSTLKSLRTSTPQSAPGSPQALADYYPFNVTISHLSPRSIEISWSCKDNTLNDRYEVTIKPVLARYAKLQVSINYKVVETVPNNMCFLLMDKLEPDTTYQVAVSSIAGRNRKRSGYVIFRTFMEDDYTEFTEDDGDQSIYEGSITDSSDADPSSSPSENAKGRLRLPRVRLVEISLVGMALVLWGGAIVLFFHRWGKIRMLLPYQPDYKEMKNNASCTTCSMTPHHQCQKIHHIQNAPTECCQAQGLTGTCHQPHTPHLPHQPLSEPGPSFLGNQNVVTVTEAGCSPIHQHIPSFHEGDISLDMSLQRQHLQRIHRKARSAEQLKQYVCPWEEPTQLQCTEF